MVFKKLLRVVKNYCERYDSTILKILVRIMIALIAYGFISLTYTIIHLFLPNFIAALVVAFICYRIVFKVARTLTFPGSSWLWRRNIENHFQRAFSIKMKKKIAVLKDVCEHFSELRYWNSRCTDEDLTEIRRMISSVIYTFEKLKVGNIITKRQSAMMHLFTEIEQLLHETKLTTSVDKNPTMWEVLESPLDYIESIISQFFNVQDDIKITFVNKEEGQYLESRVRLLEMRLNEITSKQKLVDRAKRWLFEDSFGTIDHVIYFELNNVQLRVELENRYECKRIQLKPEKSVALDCVFISGRSSDEEKDLNKKTDNSTTENSTAECLDMKSNRSYLTNATMIICCPNAGYYEYLYYENEWIDFFVRNGLNVFLWNYRGYGRSVGTPTPDALRRDGEIVVDYVRNEIGAKKIGIHGESLGGLVACYLAKTKQLDFLCADRTFSSLSNVGDFTFGKYLGALYRVLTLWNDDIVSDYLNVISYKTISFDPKDEVIHMLSSLKTGVNNKIIEKKLGHDIQAIRCKDADKFKIYLPQTWGKYFRGVAAGIKFERARANLFKELRENYEMLSKEQTNALFFALKRISELFFILSTVQQNNALGNNKKHKRSNSTENQKQNKKPMVPQHKHAGSLESSFNISNLTANLVKVANNEINMDESVLQPRGGIGGMRPDDMSFMNDTRVMNETMSDPRGLNQFDEMYLLTSVKKPSYVNLFDEDAQGSDDVIAFLLKTFSILEILEAGGTRISDVMSFDESQQIEVFKDFLLSFEVWGTYHPLGKIIEQEIDDINYHQEAAIEKIKEFVRRVDHLVNKHKTRPSTLSGNKLINSVIEDLELVSTIIPSLYQKLSISISKKGEASEITSPTSDILIKMDTKEDSVNVRLGTTEADDGPILYNSTRLGHLMPLSCGHNAPYRSAELSLYEFHLRNSRLTS